MIYSLAKSEGETGGKGASPQFHDRKESLGCGCCSAYHDQVPTAAAGKAAFHSAGAALLLLAVVQPQGAPVHHPTTDILTEALHMHKVINEEL